MVMKSDGSVRSEVRVNFLALCVSKPHIFMCGSLTLFRIVRTNVRLNIAIPSLFWSLIRGLCKELFKASVGCWGVHWIFKVSLVV